MNKIGPGIEYMMKPPRPIASQSMQKVKSSCGGQRIKEAVATADSSPFIGLV